MSDVLQCTDHNVSRPLRADEQSLIESLLSRARPRPSVESSLSQSHVLDLADGGMGSIRFVRPVPQVFGKILVEAEYLDSDGVLVIISINADTGGHLMEVDFWKVDFSALRQYPRPDELRVTSIAA